MRRALVAVVVVGVVTVVGAGPALACGGLIGRNGAVNLERTTTLAAYQDGVEHYVTSFEFNGAGGEFGSIVPLPGVPTKVERGGDWTLQRLRREVNPPAPEAARLPSRGGRFGRPRPEILIETSIDALDITVLEGGGKAVGDWAGEHGFLLPPDSPEVLDFYAKRSPIFMAARFNGERGRGAGHRRSATARPSTSRSRPPTRGCHCASSPWARTPTPSCEADVFLLTERQPALLARGQQRRVRPQPLGGRRRSRCSTDLRTRQGHGVDAVVDVAQPPEDRQPRAACSSTTWRST